MYLDRETVIDLLDKSSKNYDSNILIINTLPKDAIFLVQDEEIITAEYYDGIKDTIFVLELDYDYFNSNMSNYELEKRRVDLAIKENIDASLKNNKESVITNRMLYFLLVFSLLLTLFCSYYISTKI